MIDQDPLDDAIDRTVRDMTHVAEDDAAVARVMARLREANARERRTFAPQLAWAGAAALLLIAIVVTGYSLRSSDPATREPRIAATAPPPSSPSSPSSPSPASSEQARAVREIPTPAAATPSTLRAATARAASVANGVADASERRARDVEPELPPLESDIVIASITPAPLDDAPAIHVEPLITSSLQVDAIPLPSIEMPPVSPERQK